MSFRVFEGTFEGSGERVRNLRKLIDLSSSSTILVAICSRSLPRCYLCNAFCNLIDMIWAIVRVITQTLFNSDFRRGVASNFVYAITYCFSFSKHIPPISWRIRKNLTILFVIKSEYWSRFCFYLIWHLRVRRYKGCYKKPRWSFPKYWQYLGLGFKRVIFVSFKWRFL